jgi:hypothetical protein
MGTYLCTHALPPADPRLAADAAVQFYQLNRLTEATRRVYERSARRFCFFRRVSFQHFLQNLPVPPRVLAQWAATLARGPDPLRPNTIASYLAGVAYYHVEAGHQSPLGLEPLASVLRGITRVHGSAEVLPRFSVSIRHLSLVLRHVGSMQIVPLEVMASAAWGAYSLAHLLRNAEAVPAHAGVRVVPRLCHSRVVLLSGVTFPLHDVLRMDARALPHPDSVSHMDLLLHSSKPDRRSAGALVFGSASAYKYMVTFLRRHPFAAVLQKEAPLFPSAVPGPGGPAFPHPFTALQLRPIFERLLDQVGVDRRGTAGLSFRSGGATQLAEKGVSPALIQKMGRWSSDAYLRYLRSDLKATAEILRSALSF